MKPLTPPPEIQPLSATRWKEIGRNVFTALNGKQFTATTDSQPVQSRTGWWNWRSVASFGGLAVAAALVFALLRPVPENDTTATHIVTHDAPVSLTLGSWQVAVGPHSSMLYSYQRERVQLFLDRGDVQAKVEPLRRDARFVMHAGSVELRAVGSEFSVERDGDRVSVMVHRGTVEACWMGECLVVSAGKPGWSSVQAMYNKAQKLERAGSATAATLYRQVADAGDPKWSAVSLHALAQFHDSRGEREQARELYREYLRRFPDGANRNDVERTLEQR